MLEIVSLTFLLLPHYTWAKGVIQASVHLPYIFSWFSVYSGVTDPNDSGIGHNSDGEVMEMPDKDGEDEPKLTAAAAAAAAAVVRYQ